MLLGIISKLYVIQGNITINAITIGSNIVHENDISWSNLILGNEALTHINTKIIIQLFTPIIRPYIIPSTKGLDDNSIILLTIVKLCNGSTSKGTYDNIVELT